MKYSHGLHAADIRPDRTVAMGYFTFSLQVLLIAKKYIYDVQFTVIM